MAKTINIKYLSAWTFAISLGFFQFGHGITSFNSFLDLIFIQYEKKGINVIDNKTTFNSIVTTMVPAGALIGAMCGGLLASIGRRKAVLVIDIIIIIGSSMT